MAWLISSHYLCFCQACGIYTVACFECDTLACVCGRRYFYESGEQCNTCDNASNTHRQSLMFHEGYAIAFANVPYLLPRNPMIESKHKLAYCPVCHRYTVVCATCNNNCCNGGASCEDCKEAYRHDAAYSEGKEIKFSNAQNLERYVESSPPLPNHRIVPARYTKSPRPFRYLKTHPERLTS